MEHTMRTTINIKDDLMRELVMCTKAKNKTKAIEIAITDYIEKKSIEELISLSGKINVDLDWQKEEEIEIDEYQDYC
jgi:hypothetical protein